jgi:hypothetical protein
VAFTVDHLTKVISIPQADLTLISGTIYSMDSNQFRLDLKDWEDSEYGMAMPTTHNHNTTVTIAGITYARTIEIINGYSLEFEDGQYTVIIEGSNNNFHDVLNGILVQNQVQVIPSNSAGLVETAVSGLTPDESQKLTDIDTNVDALVIDVAFIKQIEGGRWKIDETAMQMIFYEDDNTTEVARFNLLDINGSPTGTPADAYERTRA